MAGIGHSLSCETRVLTSLNSNTLGSFSSLVRALCICFHYSIELLSATPVFFTPCSSTVLWGTYTHIQGSSWLHNFIHLLFLCYARLAVAHPPHTRSSAPLGFPQSHYYFPYLGPLLAPTLPRSSYALLIVVVLVLTHGLNTRPLVRHDNKVSGVQPVSLGWTSRPPDRFQTLLGFCPSVTSRTFTFAHSCPAD